MTPSAVLGIARPDAQADPSCRRFAPLAQAPAQDRLERPGAPSPLAPCSSGRPLEYTLLLAPRRTSVAERLLEEAGLLGDVTLRDYPLDWVPLDEDLLSLEMPMAFRVGGGGGGPGGGGR